MFEKNGDEWLAGIVNESKAVMTYAKGSPPWDSLNLDMFMDCFHKDERAKERCAHLEALGLPLDSTLKKILVTLNNRKRTDHPDKPAGSNAKMQLLQPIITFFQAEKNMKAFVFSFS